MLGRGTILLPCFICQLIFYCNRLDKAAGNRYTKKAVYVGLPCSGDETRSYAMEIYEPCQVGNKAALSRTSYAP